MAFLWAVPLWVGALSFAVGLIFHIAQRRGDQAGIAAALAGEMTVYLYFLRQADLPEVLRTLAQMPGSARPEGLRVFATLPSGHPVFDKVAGELGFLGADDAMATSRFYNVVTGFRLMLSHLGTDKFLQLNDSGQVAMLNSIAKTIDHEIPVARELIERLRLRAARRWWW